MSWLSDYIAKRRQARAELYKDRPWMTHGYWLAVIAGTLAMLYGYSRAVDYYFFTESADAAYFKNALIEQVLAGKEAIYLRDVIPYKEEFETACFVYIPYQQDPTVYMAKFQGQPVKDIPWHFRNFFVLKTNDTERVIAIKNGEITTPPLPGTTWFGKEQTDLSISANRRNPEKFFDCYPFKDAGFDLIRRHVAAFKSTIWDFPELDYYSLSPLRNLSEEKP